MALGSPSISDVKNLDVRSIQTAISNIRQRIEQLERLSGQAPAATQTGSLSLANILSQLAILTNIVNNLGDLLTMIEALPFSSGVDPEAEVPVVMNGVAVRVTAGDIARLASSLADLGTLIAALPFSSGVDPSWFVPVEIGGVAMRVTAGDIARLASTVADLGTLIAALPFSSGVGSNWYIPAEVGGVAFRVEARDIAALSPSSSGAKTVGAFWSAGQAILTAPTNDVPIYIPSTKIITAVTLLARGNTGSCAVDVWKKAYASFPPTVADSITGGSIPTIASNDKYRDTTLAGWTTTVSAGDVLMFHLASTSSFTYVEIMLELQ